MASLVILGFSVKLSVKVSDSWNRKLLLVLIVISLTCFSHLAAMAHKTLQVKDSPADVAGVCYIQYPLYSPLAAEINIMKH